MKTELKKNLIVVTFDHYIDIIDIITILYYYINNKDCIILKILLISNKKNLKWYNDITPYINKNLLLFYTKIKTNISNDNKIEETHITENDLNIDTILEIYTLNEDNRRPELLSRKEILDVMYKDWLKQL